MYQNFVDSTKKASVNKSILIRQENLQSTRYFVDIFVDTIGNHWQTVAIDEQEIGELKSKKNS